MVWKTASISSGFPSKLISIFRFVMSGFPVLRVVKLLIVVVRLASRSFGIGLRVGSASPRDFTVELPVAMPKEDPPRIDT